MDNTLVNYLVEKYGLDGPDCVRYLDDPDYKDGAVECYGEAPNSNETCWFFAGWENELLAELAR